MAMYVYIDETGGLSIGQGESETFYICTGIIVREENRQEIEDAMGRNRTKRKGS